MEFSKIRGYHPDGDDLPVSPALESVVENWMSALHPQLRSQCPFIRLAIPGSHDSMMYKMMKNSPISPEAPNCVKWLVKIVPRAVEKWVITQCSDAVEQLRNGIRYFDIRACLHDGKFMLCHGVFSGETTQPLKDINAFLDAHRKEVVILDFQHVYQATQEDHQRYCDELVAIFGKKIYSKKGNELAKCTLQELEEKGCQVIVIYRDHNEANGLFWNGEDFRTPWPETTNTKELKKFLDYEIKKRAKTEGHVSQCVLTPDTPFIVGHIFFDLRSACARPVINSLTDWIVTRKTGPENWPGHNIFIADFVDLADYRFVKAVLSLNGIKLPSFSPNGFREISTAPMVREDVERLKEKERRGWKICCCCSAKSESKRN